MSKAGKIPKDLLDKLPDATAYEKAIFPTLEQIDAAQATITKEWDSVVGANVK
jgi:putative spermidine/putrescine transport system substrate-binding protein